MSLLDNGANYEECTVYLEETTTDSDGNTITRASSIGTPTEARFQVKSQSGTASRKAEESSEGFESEQVYSMRLPRSFPYTIGAQSQVDWRNKRWSIFGDASRFNGSRKTAHITYVIKRS